MDIDVQSAAIERIQSCSVQQLVFGEPVADERPVLHQTHQYPAVGTRQRLVYMRRPRIVQIRRVDVNDQRAGRGIYRDRRNRGSVTDDFGDLLRPGHYGKVHLDVADDRLPTHRTVGFGRGQYLDVQATGVQRIQINLREGNIGHAPNGRRVLHKRNQHRTAFSGKSQVHVDLCRGESSQRHGTGYRVVVEVHGEGRGGAAAGGAGPNNFSARKVDIHIHGIRGRRGRQGVVATTTAVATTGKDKRNKDKRK